MSKPKRKKNSNGRLRLPITLLSIVLFLECAYATAVYSPIPFIAKWRTIYIETAMSTLSHQWLATWFIPRNIIDAVMADVQADIDSQAGLSSSWGDLFTQETDPVTETPTVESEPVESEEVEPTAEELFYEKYWELDTDSVHLYFEEHPALVKDGYDDLYINNMDGSLELYTVNGDPVRILDAENNILIVKVKGDGYQGKLAIVKNPKQVDVVSSSQYGSMGQQICTIASNNGAVMAMNASGFIDVEGHGLGNQIVGSYVLDGVEIGDPDYSSSYKFFGFKSDYRMYISNYADITPSEYLWGIQFFPALIVDGESVVDGTFGMGIQPRASFGQASNGDVLMLVIDGRQAGYSLGCTVAECTKILLSYDCYQAMNLDGGSSALLWYDGENITSPSSVSSDGRLLPNCFVVYPASEVDD
jgi:exopolysaccharide biosynthesis protein